jgi:pyrroline-5-carboxylate reductase
MKTIGIIGGGRITRILLQAFKNAHVTFDNIRIYDIEEKVLTSLNARFPQIQIAGNLLEVIHADLVILAVHPPVVMETLEKIKAKLKGNTVFLSLAPKFGIAKLESILGDLPNIARMNPSAAAIVNKGVNPVAFSVTFDKTLKESLTDLLKPLGYLPEVTDSKIEAYAVISAMGHTYFNFQLQKLKELAVAFGMNEDEAATAVSKMLAGTTETLFNAGMTYQEVNDLVPVKPMSEVEEIIKGYYDKYLTEIYNKIKI